MISLVTTYSGSVPNRASQSQTQFSAAANTWTSYQAVTLVPDINVSIGQMNTAIQDVNDNAIAAQNAANSAAGSANYAGKWSSLTGSLNKGVSVSHNSTVWLLENDLADVTASEPSVTSDWISTSSRAQTKKISNGQSLIAGIVNEIQSTISVNAPISTTMIADTYIDIYVARKYTPLALTIDAQSTDLFEDSNGTDTQVVLNFNSAGSYRIRTDGAGKWEL